MGEEMVFLAAVLGTFFLGASVQAVTGFGAALVVVPLLSLLTDPLTAVVAATASSGLLTAGVTVRERHLVDRDLARRLTTAAVWGMPLGLAFVALADPRHINAVIGISLLGLVLVLVMARQRAQAEAARTRAWGTLSGVLLTSTGMNGPPLIMATRGLDPQTFRATLQAVFFAQDVAALILLGLIGHVSRDALLISMIGAAALPLGWAAGDHLFARVDRQLLRKVVLVGLAATATVMLLTVV